MGRAVGFGVFWGIVEAAGLEVFFDYILEADDNAYADDSDETLASFTSYVAEREGRELTLNVYSARRKSLRLVRLVPRRWEGVGLLGLSVKFSEFSALDEGARVVNVHEGSPAAAAGLVPFTDYLLATSLQLLVDYDCARVHIAERVGQEVRVYVYNSITESIRVVAIVPRHDWGGRGTLGCDLANGYIHRIPLVKDTWNFPKKETDAADPPGDLGNFGGDSSDSRRDSVANAEPYLPPSIVDLRVVDAVGDVGGVADGTVDVAADKDVGDGVAESGEAAAPSRTLEGVQEDVQH